MNLDFVSKLNQDLVSLNRIIKELKKDLTLTQSDLNSSEISYGSLVEVVKPNIPKTTGRVWGSKTINGVLKFEVNKKGCTSYENIEAEHLKNLSIGFIGEAEKALWIAERNKQNIIEILKDSELDPLLKEDGVNIIEVIRTDYAGHCKAIDFVLAKNLKTGRMKLPEGLISELGFYMVEIADNKIISIKKSSKAAFDKMELHFSNVRQ